MIILAKFCTYLVIYFSSFNAVESQANYPKVTSEGISQEVVSNIYFQFYEGPTVNDYQRVGYSDGLSFAANPKFHKDHGTVFHFHGWGEKPNEHQDSVDELASAFLSKNEVNFVAIDYSSLVRSSSTIDYLWSVQNSTDIGKSLAQYFEQYVQSAQPLEQLHLTSHSLGSQVLSRTAHDFTQGKFKWLTGLDPAGPIFNLPGVRHLSSEDGEFVDIIHTDSYKYGDGRTVGTVDFFPNGGHRVQPPCVSQRNYPFCSHHMSWRFYGLSIRNETLYPAVKCKRTAFCDYIPQTCRCKTKDVEYMGYGVDKRARGTYYLSTGVDPPYSPTGVYGQ